MIVIKVDANGKAHFDVDSQFARIVLAIFEHDPFVMIGKAAISFFSQESLDSKIAGNIERVIKSGKDNGVDCMEIQCEKTIGLTAKMKQYGATITAGNSGSTVIKVRYK